MEKDPGADTRDETEVGRGAEEVEEWTREGARRAERHLREGEEEKGQQTPRRAERLSRGGEREGSALHLHQNDTKSRDLPEPHWDGLKRREWRHRSW